MDLYVSIGRADARADYDHECPSTRYRYKRTRLHQELSCNVGRDAANYHPVRFITSFILGSSIANKSAKVYAEQKKKIAI